MRSTRLTVLVLLAFASVFVVTAAYAAGQTVVAYPKADVTVDGAFPDTNEYAWGDLYVSQSQWFGNSEALLRFDLSQVVPAGAKVTKAVLYLSIYSIGDWGLNMPDMQAQQVAGPWDESAVTWNTRPPLDASVLDSQSVDYWLSQSPDLPVPFDVTGAVDSTDTVDVAITMSGEGGVADFYSAEWANPFYWPYMQVTYEVENDPPSVTAQATTTTLLVPNGKTANVQLTGTITGGDGGIQQAWVHVDDEYGALTGNTPITSIDAAGRYSVAVPLVASRYGYDKNGRQYTLTVDATDGAGNTSSATPITVVVPHDQR